jgi:hypothetical protein
MWRTYSNLDLYGFHIMFGLSSLMVYTCRYTGYHWLIWWGTTHYGCALNELRFICTFVNPTHSCTRANLTKDGILQNHLSWILWSFVKLGAVWVTSKVRLLYAVISLPIVTALLENMVIKNLKLLLNLKLLCHSIASFTKVWKDSTGNRFETIFCTVSIIIEGNIRMDT